MSDWWAAHANEVFGRTWPDVAEEAMRQGGLWDGFAIAAIILVALNWRHIARRVFPGLARMADSPRDDGIRRRVDALERDFKAHDNDCEERHQRILDDLAKLKSGDGRLAEGLAEIRGYLKGRK